MQEKYSIPQAERGSDGHDNAQGYIAASENLREQTLLARVVFWLCMVLGPVVLLSVIAMGIAAFRLSQGPISLPFLTERLERGIASEFGGFEPKISNVVVALNDNYGFEVQLENLQLKDVRGEVVASAPSAAVELNHAALLSGRVVASRVALIEPRVFLFYSKDDGLSLSFSTSSEQPQGQPELVRPPKPATRDTANLATANEQAAAAPTPKISLAKLIADATRNARLSPDRQGGLQKLGLRDATVTLDYEGRQSVWQVPNYDIDLKFEAGRSNLSGAGQVLSELGPWTLAFQLEDVQQGETVAITTSIRDLSPRILAAAIPELQMLQSVDTAVSSDMKVVLSQAGDILAADAELSLARGMIVMDLEGRTEVPLDASVVKLKYDPQSQSLELLPSVLRSGNTQLQLVGLMKSSTTPSGVVWPFKLQLIDGWLAGASPETPPVKIKTWNLAGQLEADASTFRLDRFFVEAGDGSADISAVVDYGNSTQGTKVVGKLSAMTLATSKALWPLPFATYARDWIDAQVDDASLKGGQFSFYSGRFFKEDQAQASSGSQRLSASIEFADVVMRPVPKMFPVEMSRALLRLENDTLEISVPASTVVIDRRRSFDLRAAVFKVGDLFSRAPDAQVTFKGKGDVDAALAIVGNPAVSFFKDGERPPQGLTGDVDGTVKISFPLIKDLTNEQVAFESQMSVKRGQAKGVFGDKSIEDAAIEFDVSQTSLAAKGTMLLEGVSADVSWQRIFSASLDQQPPIRITATLDNADRRQLGLETDGFVNGNVPVEITLQPKNDLSFERKIRADFSNANVALKKIGWVKVPGRNMFLEADIADVKTGRTELQNITVRGDKLAAEGWVALNRKSEVVEFFFPVVALDVVSQFDLKGQRLGKGNWRLIAKGSVFDGRGFYKSLFSLDQTGRGPARRSDAKSVIDLSARFDTIIGFEEQNLRSVSVKLKQTGGRLTAMTAKGTLENGRPVAIKLVGQASNRQLRADSTDAGRVFKMVGFYPNVRGGRVRLEVNLDQRGAAEKSGVLWVDNFEILGDPIVSEVVDGGQGSGPSRRRRGKRQQTREVLQFDRMKAPFSVGHDQFVLQESYLKGPLIGASIRGKVDYRARRLSLGGTYVPLQGINNALGDIPLLGQILSGPRGEGLFGITFAISGPMARPEVIVNPLSIATPGIFRELMQIAPHNPTVQARPPLPGHGSNRVRSSSAPSESFPPFRPPAPLPGTIDGWSSQTTGSDGQKR